ncbi:hypothetical protein GSI_12075 [Ganoderma sinense ZZ0214-1]|uniref:Carboxylesterase type B domain-containing protein n=1 Tax=Ganoderma sinense ZZ0214-1 TaxID=1077348 RepID=A0A2G8RXS1_9APHY|nr:hypothetical protein GSI_12075 [Ganoderma sinense ZZ0214-1]
MAFPCNIRLLGCIAILLSLAPWSVHASAPTVEVNGTDIIGTVQTSTSVDNTTVEFFGGIPFAQPPVGVLRFASPVELDSLGVPTFNATTFGPPASSPIPGIYGGGFNSGLSAAYDATNIVGQSLLRETPVIYVSINYRVGPFGFPQGTEAGLLGAVNLGLRDQLAAISWVQKHISAFGGDPTKVTLFGQDAGAMSIGHLFLNAGLENYGVRGVIMESGSSGSLPLFDSSRRDLVWDAFAANISACAGVLRGSTSPCLRCAPTSALLSSWEAAAAVLPDLDLFVPVLDGPDGLIPDLPSALLAAGRVSKIPFISGTSFVPQALSNPIHLFEFFPAAEFPYPQTYSPQFRQDIQGLLIQYYNDPDLRSPFGTGNETFGTGDLYKLAAASFGDITFEAPRRQWTQAAAAAAAGVTVYSYVFADQNVAVADPSLGVRHGSELPYVYGFSNIETSSLESVLVSRAMVDYWLSFVASGTPNDGKGLTRTIWPNYESDNQVLIQFDTASIASGSSNATFAIVADDYRAVPISFINSVATDFNQ